MLVSSELDLNWYFQVIFSWTAGILAILYLIKNTASRYFEVDASFEGDQQSTTYSITGSNINSSIMPGVVMDDNLRCFICGQSSTKKCSRCKAVRYCSQKCQESHWRSGHKKDCKVVDQTKAINPTKTIVANGGSEACDFAAKTSSSIALVPPRAAKKVIKQPKEVLFPYGEFLRLFNWDKLGFPPCGLRNCGNSCFANVVLQCLTFTRPLAGFLLEKGHRSECHRNDWCFLCEFQSHIERASSSSVVISPMNILSHLPNIGGTLGYGSQEDAHEFMRFAIDTMQSVFLGEFGGEKAVDHSSQETTLIQHIFGGHLQSQVVCAKCNNVSNQYENMMDLTVEIQGDAESLEKCLDQFTVKEYLHGENKYKCDGCNDYVKAWKRLTIKRAPNILTIALKRFQSGRFGKLNKRVSFPETLDLSPYMSETGDGSDVYKLYGVVVHVDMLNASYFGHYVCYIKDFCGKWYRIDDWKVLSVDLQDVLSQGAYMLLYSRVCARPSCLKFPEYLEKEKQVTNEKMVCCKNEKATCPSLTDVGTPSKAYMVLPADATSKLKAASVPGCRAESNALSDQSGIMVAINGDPCSTVLMRETCSIGNSSFVSSQPVENCHEDTRVLNVRVSAMEEPSCYTKDSSAALDHELTREEHNDNVAISMSSTMVNEIDTHAEESCVAMDCQSLRQELKDTGVLKYESSACLAKVSEDHIKGHMNAEMFLSSLKNSTKLVHAVNSVGTGIRTN